MITIEVISQASGPVESSLKMSSREVATLNNVLDTISYL